MSYWWRINSGLVVVLTILAGLLFWPEPSVPIDRLTALSADDVRSVRIERGNRLVLALQRDTKGWQLTHPQSGTAAIQHVQRLLSVLEAPILQRIPAGSTAADFGLAPPRALVRFDDVEIRFGNPDLSHRLRYVAVDDDVFVIDDAFFNLLALPARHYLGS